MIFYNCKSEAGGIYTYTFAANKIDKLIYGQTLNPTLVIFICGYTVYFVNF